MNISALSRVMQFSVCLGKGWCPRGLMLGADERLKWQRKGSCPLESSWGVAARSAQAGGLQTLTYIGTQLSLQCW